MHPMWWTAEIISQAVVVATGVTEDGGGENLGLDVGDSEDETFWRAFLTSLNDRGLSEVRLVISDQHAGLVKALTRCFAGASHQRCRVHFARNLLALVPKSHKDMAAAVFRTVFVAARLLLTLAAHTRLLTGSSPQDGIGTAPTTGEYALLDVDDTIIEVHGHQKQGAGFGYSRVRGLDAFLATLTPAGHAPLIVAQPLRKGSWRFGVGSPRSPPGKLRKDKEATPGATGTVKRFKSQRGFGFV